MSSESLCRLCFCTFENNFIQLIKPNGECTEAYDIASKYFDSMLLINDQQHNLAVLCLICWQHIHDFYTFQQEVYQTHSKLDEVKDICSSLKLEDGCANDNLNAFSNVSEEKLKNEKDLTDTLDCESILFSSEDEKPLLEKYKSQIGMARRKRIQKGSYLNYKDNVQKCKRKKSKLGFASCRNKTEIQLKTLEYDAFIASYRSQLDCDKCTESFKDFHLLQKHFQKNHSEEKCYIKCCGRKFKGRYYIVEHIKLHVNPNAFRCEICGKCSTNSRNLAKHKMEQHSEEGKQRSLECSICTKILANKNSLRVHMETHETNLLYSCQTCGKTFPSEQKRTQHERYVHAANLICDQCGKKQHNHYAMKQHLLQHAGRKKKWPCELCLVELNSSASLKRHKQLMHQERTTAYVCSDCGKVLTTEIALRTHKRNVHLSIRNHKCSFCEKAFKSPRALREHVTTHTGEYLYQCPHCERTFKTSANFHHHRKKDHPKEWEEGRLNRPQAVKINLNSVNKEVVI